MRSDIRLSYIFKGSAASGSALASGSRDTALTIRLTLTFSRAPPQAALPSPQVRAIQRSPFGSPLLFQGLRRKRLCPRLRFARYSAHHSAHPVSDIDTMRHTGLCRQEHHLVPAHLGTIPFG